MFGVVPRVLWSRLTQPDDQNRISLVTRTLLALNRERKRIILVDTGCGSKWTPDEAARFAIEHDAHAIDRTLTDLGFTRADVTDVVVTHLHFDHNGGLTDWANETQAATIPRYPHARHWIHRRHWMHANQPHAKDRASFRPQDWKTLEQNDQLAFVDGLHPSDPLPGLKWHVTHGHTPFQLHPEFSDGDSSRFWAGDLIPTRHHLNPPWVMAYDLEPTRTIDEKCAVYERSIDRNSMLALPHDTDCAAVTLTGAATKPIATPVPDL